jgi:hypothetical protein
LLFLDVLYSSKKARNRSKTTVVYMQDIYNKRLICLTSIKRKTFR